MRAYRWPDKKAPRVALPLRTCGLCGQLTTSAPGERVVWRRANVALIVHAECARLQAAGKFVAP